MVLQLTSTTSSQISFVIEFGLQNSRERERERERVFNAKEGKTMWGTPPTYSFFHWVRKKIKICLPFSKHFWVFIYLPLMKLQTFSNIFLKFANQYQKFLKL